MPRERVENRQIGSHLESGPLTDEEKVLGLSLYYEGLLYKKVYKNIARIVGKHHLSYLFLPDKPDNKAITIHFREGLWELEDLAHLSLSYGKQFLRNLQGDLGILALMLKEKDMFPQLANVEEIWGLCSLSPDWGRRHGFWVKTWSNDPNLIDPFNESIDGPKVLGLALQQPLSLFLHRKPGFIENFG